MIKKYLPKSEFGKNVLTLMTGTTIGQIIPVLISPIVTRLYSPEDYGMFAVFLSITAILSVISTGRFEFAIVVTDDDEKALNLTALSIIVSFFLSLLILFLIIIFHTRFSEWLGNAAFSGFMYLIPVALFLNGLYQTLAQLLNREKEYKTLSTGKILQPVTTGITQVSFGFLHFGNGLIVGNILGIMSASATLFSRSFEKFKKGLFNFSPIKLKETAIEFKDLPKYSVLGSFLNSLSFNLVSVILTYLFSSVIVGYYALIFRVLSSPSMMIGSAVGQVYLEQASSEKKKSGHSLNTFLFTSKRLLIVGIPIFVLLFFFIEDIFGIVFGVQWKPAGEYARLLLPLFLVRFLSATLSGTLNVYEKWKPSLLIHFSLLSGTLITFACSYFFHFSFSLYLYFYTGLMSVLYLLFYFYYYRISGRNASAS